MSTQWKKRYLVLGGKGFVGSHLVDALLSQGHWVRLFDRPGTVFLDGACTQHRNLEIVEGDFCSESDIAAAVEDCNGCFHLVSTTLPKSSNLDPVYDIETNLIGTVRLLNHALRAHVTRVIFLSSGGAVYGPPMELPISETHPTNPICSYGITKLAVEKYLGMFEKLHGLEYVVLRLSNIYGERQRTQASQGAVAVFLGKILQGEKVEIWGDGSVVRDYIHITDAVTALIAAANMDCELSSERVFNIGSGYGISLNEVLAEIEFAMGMKVERNYLEGRPFDVPSSVLAIDRARQVLGWEPAMSFPAGLRLTLDWLDRQQSSSNSVGN
jgi:UDP-glucose 4-epimerase